MACIKGPTVFPPVFPPGISLPTITLPVPPTVGLCCYLPLPFPSSISLPSIPIPASALAPIMAIFDQINAALDAVQFSCPLE